MSGATWRGRPMTLAEFMGDGSALIVQCGSTACRSASVVDDRIVAIAARSSVTRLEDGVRCSCGSRRGVLQVWKVESAPPEADGRCFLFHC